MRRTKRLRGVRANRSYTVAELANAIGVTEQTVRAWIKAGLPAMDTSRPTLIRGADIVSFSAEKQETRRRKLARDEFYCLTCKAPRRPLGSLVDYVPTTSATGRMEGLCEFCERACNKMVSKRELPALETVFEISVKDG